MGNSEYQALCHMLRHAIVTERRHDEYIQMILEDAKIVRRYPERAYTIHHETYRYATALGRSEVQIVESIDTASISIEDYRMLLSFFENM